MNADSIKIESDEDGFHLIVDVQPGTWLAQTHLDINIQDVAEALYDTVKREIGPWLYERGMARDAANRDHERQVVRDVFRCNPDESAGLRDLAVSTAYDTAYEITDPSHPEFHSVHADLWDGREKC